jgi:hypothetical protein
MNIADFAMRGNPEDMDDDFEPLAGAERTQIPKKGHELPKTPSASRPLPKSTFVIIAVLVLSSSASFGLGLLAQGSASKSANGGGLLVGAVPTTEPSSAVLSASVLDSTHLSGSATATSSIPVGGEVIGASDTRRYYLPWCPQASKISKTNTVWFATEQMAKSAGYTAGENCPGI